MGWRLVCCALLLFASARIFAGELVLTSLSADAWVTGDLMRQILVIHQPPPTAPIQIRGPAGPEGQVLPFALPLFSLDLASDRGENSRSSNRFETSLIPLSSVAKGKT